ncbi:MAG: cell division protein ZapA [Lachnospiraceae bacterium]
MIARNKVTITLSDKTYDLVGNESQAYLNMVAQYIENKYEEFHKNPTFKLQAIDMQHVLLELNIADDYFKSKEKVSMQLRELADKEKQLIELKRQLVEAQIRSDNCSAQMLELQKQIAQMGKI